MINLNDLENNTALFNELIIKEPQYIDPDYFLYASNNILSDCIDKPNAIMKANQEIIKLIDQIELMGNNKFNKNKELENLYSKLRTILKRKYANKFPLVQYFAVHNMSLSVFKSLSDSKQMDILRFIIPNYISERHHKYKEFGYSPIVMQVLNDTYSSRRKAGYGIYKINKIMQNIGVPKLIDINDRNNDYYYLLCDNDGKSIFKEINKEMKIPLTDKGRKTEKYPDAFIKIRDEYFVVEHKQIKEVGGSQDKQMKELISFIDRSNVNKIHHIAILDGTYFKFLKDSKSKKSGKLYKQLIDTTKALTNHRENYFLDSEYFQNLLSEYVKNSEYSTASKYL